MERTKEEIEDLIRRVADCALNGLSKYFGMSYKQGVYETARWILGEIDDHPYPEE